MQVEPYQRLKDARKTIALSLEKFGDAMGVSNQAVSNWETGRTPISMMVARSIEVCHGISSKWLIHGEGDMFVNKLDGQEASETPMIVPILSPQPCMGDGNMLDDYVDKIGGLPFGESWLHDAFGVSPKNLCLLKVTGDSMLPTINSGQLVFVDGLHETPEYCDGVWVLRMRGKLFVKRVHQLGYDEYEITSDNPAYGPLEPDESTQLLGRVVGLPKRF